MKDAMKAGGEFIPSRAGYKFDFDVGKYVVDEDYREMTDEEYYQQFGPKTRGERFRMWLQRWLNNISFMR